MIFLKFIFSFIVSFLILAFPISNQTIFSYINEATSPFTQRVFQKIKTGIHQGSNWSKKIFTNSTPTEDKISSRQSSTQKQKIEKEIKMNSIKESYTPEERELLKKIFEQNK